MTTYTVFRSEDYSSAERGLSLEEAAEALLTNDGYAYEIRVDYCGYHELFISDASANSMRGARTFVVCPAFNGWDKESVLQKVVADTWRGKEAMSDGEFAGVMVMFVKYADDLDGLLDALKALGRSIPAAEYEALIDITNLQTFGGIEPADTAGIWSWDESRLLVGTCIDDMQIVPRPT